MNDIKCPHCSKAFKIDESGYADILKQVRDQDFDQQLNERLQLAEKEKSSALELAQEKASRELQKAAADKNFEIQKLQAELGIVEEARKLAVAKAVVAVEKERDKLASDLEQSKQESKTASEVAELKRQKELQETSAQKDAEIQGLRAKIESSETSQKLAEKSLKEKYETQIQDKDDEIDRQKNLKAKLSTKMIGETLEQHCETEFNQLRATAFPNAYFEKDNDAKTGSKGDYIFKDADPDGNEIVSIMFEMKNESDTTATKKKNENFFKELDKDRHEKNCEYAILVSLLEPESELYNSGIVDVSHRYKKMYVIRPQFFIPMITLLRNPAMNTLKYKSELALVKTQRIDVTSFEADLEDFKSKFGRNFELASSHFQKAVDEIDKSILHMQKTRESLLKSVNQLRLSNDKAQDLTVKKLTRGNTTMKSMFDSIDKNKPH